MSTFAIPNENNTFENAEIAQLVEHNLAKVRVASSSLVFRSKRVSRNADLNFENNPTGYNYMQVVHYYGRLFFILWTSIYFVFFKMCYFCIWKTSC